MAVSADNRTVITAGKPNGGAGVALGTIVRYALLSLAALIAFAPFLLSLLGTFKSNAELTAFPPSILPERWTLDTWTRVWNFTLPSVEGRVLPRWLFNSTWLALVNVAAQLFFCSLAAYAFARIRFPGRDLIFSLALATMAIPAAVTLLPGYVFFARLGWIDTYWPLIIPNIVTVSGIFLLRQFFLSIPKELEEAAYLDGLGRFGTYWNIAMPLAKPALITLGILQFQGSWNDYLKPLLFLQNVNLMTLPVGMGFFKGQYTNDFGALLVGAMFNAIPVLALFFFFNRYYTQSGSYSGLAGQ
ncbi:MAG TPA: carbohydrate ABC transporter permease [Roseiflexaceae bacterium]|nr:carbohydrate ABC transporter permease [Roseiflexaceae bacterium]